MEFTAIPGNRCECVIRIEIIAWHLPCVIFTSLTSAVAIESTVTKQLEERRKNISANFQHGVVEVSRFFFSWSREKNFLLFIV